MKVKHIRRVLMCRPLYFTVDYVINPWMKPGSADTKKALVQWDNLVKTYIDLGIKVEIIDQQKGWPDMLYATDQAIVQGRNVLMSRFRHKERRGESQFYEQWFFEHAYTISHLPENHYFEGNGESYFWNQYLFIGTGYRSDKQTASYLQTLFHHTIVPLHIVDPAFYHLDVGFFPLNNETAFYFPDAYTPNSQKLLKSIVPNLIPFTLHEAHGFSANSIVHGKTVLVQKGNPTFLSTLHSLGYETREIDVSEIMKGGGGIHCLTNILEEVEDPPAIPAINIP